MNELNDKFADFEWLTKGVTAKSPNFEPNVHGTNEQPLTYEDRLGAIASMSTQLAKSITAVIIYDGKAQADYELVRKHLSSILICNATDDKKREPEHISIAQLGHLVARMVIDFTLHPEYQDFYTAAGKLHYAGLTQIQMNADQYRMTWKKYESMMFFALDGAINEAIAAINLYKKNTYKEMVA